MEDQELRTKLADIEKKISDVYISAEKTRKYFLWVLVISAVVFVLPLIGILFAIPSVFSMYGSLGGLQ